MSRVEVQPDRNQKHSAALRRASRVEKQSAVHTLGYGSGSCTFSLPEGTLIQQLEPRTPNSLGTTAEILARSLRQPIGTPPLREIAVGKRSAVILIPGKARRAGTQEYVPALIAELQAGGIPADGIEVVLADGTHEQHLETDVNELLGNELASQVRCWGHDCHKEEDLRHVGTTSFGTPVYFNRRVLDAEVKILTGRIVPHYFAGFSGGRKALVPGVAGFRTIVANHRLTLGAERGIHKDVRACSLSANPVHLDMVEAARMAQPDFCLNTLLDAEHRLVSAVAGHAEAAHQEGCRQAAHMFRLSLSTPVDVLITSAGGLPYDSNFMQALKAVFNVGDIVRPGGAILWVAECAGGIHPGFLGWAKIPSDLEQDQAVRRDYSLTGHNSLMLRQLVRNSNVALCSQLPPDAVTKLGLHPVNSVEDGLDWIRKKFPRGFSYAVVPHANAICAAIS